MANPVRQFMPVQPFSANTSTVAVDKKALMLDLRQLAAMLADLDSGSTILVEKLSPQLNALGQYLAALNLLRLVGEFEFDEALVCLREVACSLGTTL